MRRIILLALLVLPFVFGSAQASHDSDSHTYVGGTGDAAWLACPDPDCPAEYIGGAPFALEGDEVTASVSITDIAGPTTAAFYQFDGGDGEPIEGESGAFCDAASLNVPAGATTLHIFISEAFAVLDCGNARAAGVMGQIDVAWGY